MFKEDRLRPGQKEKYLYKRMRAFIRFWAKERCPFNFEGSPDILDDKILGYQEFLKIGWNHPQLFQAILMYGVGSKKEDPSSTDIRQGLLFMHPGYKRLSMKELAAL